MKKAVVTGGAGFIGSHLAEELAGRGYQVIILDDLSTGKEENIAPLLEKGSASFVQGSVTDLPWLQKLFQGVDLVFHLAAMASVPQSLADPAACHEINLTGTLNVLLAARDGGAKKVVYASSCAVYGDRQTLPLSEDMPPHPQSPYAVTKLAGEYYCQAFQEVYGLPAVCLRYFNVYGPGQDPDSPYAAVIPRFISRAAEVEPLTIYGDGEQTRDFIFVKDAVAAAILATESQAGGIFNIGSGNGTSLNRLAELIIRLSGSDTGIVHQEPRAGDVKHSLADISKAEKLGYNPASSLEEGLRAII